MIPWITLLELEIICANVNRQVASKEFSRISDRVSIAILHEHDSQGQYVVDMVTKYRIDSLKSLQVFYARIRKAHAVKWKPIVKRLQLLDLTDVEISDDRKLFAHFDSLIELALN